VRYSFQNVVQQSVHFKIEKSNVEKAWEGLTGLFDELDFNESAGFYTHDGGKSDLYRFLDLPTIYLRGSFKKDDMKHYIDLCNDRGKLTNWKIAIRRTGTGRKFHQDGLKLALTKRSAPKPDEFPYYGELKNEMLFTASGKSMNIMTSGQDEALGLSQEVIDQAIAGFRDIKKAKLIESGKSVAKSIELSEGITIPGWIFRKVRPENQGLLLIYLIDQHEVFNNDELKASAAAKGINIDIPLIGYALSFPQIDDDPGANYMANDYVSSFDAKTEVRNDDNEIPEDFTTEVNDIN
jgi:hypothetical protein